MDSLAQILTAMENYEQKAEGRKFSAAKLKKSLEPTFVQSGYRECSFSKEIVRILIIYDGGVGDFIMFTPVLREIKRIYCQGQITLLIPHFLENIAAACPYIDNLVIDVYRHKQFTKGDAFKLYLHTGIAEKLLAYQFSLAFNFSISDNGALLCYMSGAKERILCLDKIVGAASDKEVPIVSARELSTAIVTGQAKSRHAVDQYLQVLDSMLHLPISNREMEVWFTADDLQTAKMQMKVRKNTVLAVLGLGGMNHQKKWPVERYAELAKKISVQDKNIQFVLVGGEKETSSAKILEKKLSTGNCCNLVGKLTYRQTAAAMSFCHLYIGNDTGSMHIAAALKIPVLAVFCCPSDHSPNTLTTVERVFPYGVPAVVVRPDKRLPECVPGDGSFDIRGCIQDSPHCIMQVTVEDMWKGYCTLVEMIKKL